jgi:tRNA threonylcarbamoyladenosine biosynthesis protein TsaE
MAEQVLTLADEAATLGLGRRLAACARAGDVLALVGELGAGKTTLVHGLATGLGVAGPVPSPTFVLVRDYPVAAGGPRLRLVHVDAYRLANEDEALAIGLDEELPGDGLTAVEWADRIAGLLPPHTLWVALTTLEDGRQATLATDDLERWLGEVRA